MRRFPLRWTPVLPLVIALLSGGCSSDPAEPQVEIATLLPSPAEGAPGTLVAVRGLDASASSLAEWEVYFGDRPTAMRIQPDGSLLVAVPLFLADDGRTPQTPPVAVDLVVLRDGQEVGRGAGVFTVRDLLVAPGALEAVQAALVSIVDGLRVLAEGLEPMPGVAQAYASAGLGAISDLLDSESPVSLARQIEAMEGAGDGGQPLVEGFLAAGGMVEQLQTVASLLAQLDLPTGESRGTEKRLTETDDFDLASRMQLYTMVRDFGTQVLAQTNADWGMTGGLLGATLGLVRSVPVAGTVSAVLGVATFALNNVALAYLPARVESFELEVVEPLVPRGEVAQTHLWIEAVNAPAPITFLDLVDLLLTTMGFANDADRASFRGILGEVANYFLDRIRSLLSAYAGAHPEVDLAFDLASIPPMRWKAEVLDPRFAVARSHTPELIDANEGLTVRWRAGIGASGEGRIYADMKTGPDVVVIPLISGYEYHAGAFGEDLLQTAVQTVSIGAPLVLTATMDSTITAGGINGLEVRAGRRNAVGDIEWVEGVEITLTAQGGQVDPAGGVTGTDGRFDSFVRLDEGSTVVEVTVSARNAEGFEAETTVSARTRDAHLEIRPRFVTVMESSTPQRLAIDVTRVTEGGSTEEAFAEVSLTVEGGSASPAAGTLDDEGSWDSDISLDPSAEEVVVRIHVVATDGLQADAVVRAANAELVPIRITSHVYRAWLNVTATNGPLWRLYRDNIANPNASDASVSWTYTSNGERDGKTCAATGSLSLQSHLAFDPSGAVPQRWEANGALGVTLESSGLTEFDNPVCTANAQIQLSLAFRVNEGSWRVRWDVVQVGEDDSAHPQWKSQCVFTDVQGVHSTMPPEATPQGEAVVSVGDHTLRINPTIRGGIGAAGDPNAVGSGGFSLVVEFSRVGGG